MKACSAESPCLYIFKCSLSLLIILLKTHWTGAYILLQKAATFFATTFPDLKESQLLQSCCPPCNLEKRPAGLSKGHFKGQEGENSLEIAIANRKEKSKDFKIKNLKPTKINSDKAGQDGCWCGHAQPLPSLR